MFLDHERDLAPRLDRRATCANPFCSMPTRVAGEFCPSCTATQQQTRETLRQRPRPDDAV